MQVNTPSHKSITHFLLFMNRWTAISLSAFMVLCLDPH